MTKTAERLQEYWEFDEAVLAAVEETAYNQNQRSFKELAAAHDLPAIPKQVYPYEDSLRTIQYWDLKPTADYDESRARVLFAPFGIVADECMAMRAMRLFDAQPDQRLFVLGSPGSVGRRRHSNLIRIEALVPAWRGDLSGAAHPLLHHLAKQNITNIDTMGYSYGAELAAESSRVATDHEITVDHGVWAEPVAVIKRSLNRLLQDFRSSEAPLKSYIKAANSQPLNEARDLTNRGFSRYILGLLRASNVAVAHTLADDGFKNRADTALTDQPELRTTIAWGTASEITENDAATEAVQSLRDRHGVKRVAAMALEGMHHAGGDDIDLHAAIMLQGLRAR